MVITNSADKVYISIVYRKLRLDSLRIKVALRRKIKWYLFGRREQTCSVYNLERRSSVNATEIIEVSPNTFVEIWDPRSKKVISHSFQSRSIFRVENVVLEPRQGLIYSSEGKLLSESTVWQDERIFLSFPWAFKKSRVKSRSFDTEFITHISSNSFYHWLVEDLPQLIITLEKFPNVQILKRSDSPKYVNDFLNMLGIDFINIDSPVFLSELLFVSRGKDSGWPLSEDIYRLRNHEVIKSHIQENASRLKIYISRKKSTRSPKNEDDVENLFRRFGFEIYYLEDMSFAEQIELISSSQFLAGIHGAGLTHSIWMSEGASVIDIVSDKYWTECFHRLADIRNLKYLPFVREGFHEDELDLFKLETFLKEIFNPERIHRL